jgi:hypothetical protein
MIKMKHLRESASTYIRSRNEDKKKAGSSSSSGSSSGSGSDNIEGMAQEMVDMKQ